MSTPGPYSGQYFGDYFGDYLGAESGVTPGLMVGTAHISLSAFGVLTDGQAPKPATSYWSDRPWRDVPFIPITPRRPRRRRQEDLIFLGR